MEVKLIKGSTSLLMTETPATIKERVTTNTGIEEPINPIAKILKGNNTVEGRTDSGEMLLNGKACKREMHSLLKEFRRPIGSKNIGSRRGRVRDVTSVINDHEVRNLPSSGGPKSKILAKSVDLTSISFRIKRVRREASNITSGLGVLKLVNVERQLTNIKKLETSRVINKGREMLIRLGGVSNMDRGEIMSITKENHGPINPLINTQYNIRGGSKLDSEPGSFLNDSFMPLQNLKGGPRENPDLTKKTNTIGLEVRMFGDPPRDRGNPITNVSPNGESKGSVVGGIAKKVTKLPDNSSRRAKFKKDSRENIDPNMIELAEVSATHKRGTIMGDFNEVMEEAFPQRGQSLMEVGDSGVRQQLIEPNSIKTKVKVTT